MESKVGLLISSVTSTVIIYPHLFSSSCVNSNLCSLFQADNSIHLQTCLPLQLYPICSRKSWKSVESVLEVQIAAQSCGFCHSWYWFFFFFFLTTIDTAFPIFFARVADAFCTRTYWSHFWTCAGTKNKICVFFLGSAQCFFKRHEAEEVLSCSSA